MKPKVLVTRRVPEPGLARIRAACDMKLWDSHEPIPRAILLSDVADVEGLYCLLTEKVDAELLDAAPHLKVISNMAVGFDNIDVAECTRRRIPAGNTPGVLTETTADLAWALMMAAARRLVEGADYVRAGRWTTWGPLLLLGSDVHGATLGILGLGRIGKVMARRAHGFNMRVLYYDHARDEAAEAAQGVTFADFDSLLRQSDFVTIHTTLGPATRHLIDASALAKMKPTAVLVNTARGPIVDPQALYDALKSGMLFAAALDVTEPEPLPPDHPLVTLPNCLVVPHIGSASVVTRTKMAIIAADNLIAGLSGDRLLHCVNPSIYES